MQSIWNRILKWLDRLRGKLTASAEPVPAEPPIVPATPAAPASDAWRRCRLASCWDGADAARRHMNLLSPHFDDAKVESYLDWQRARGTDTLHLILCNRADGEGGGYSIYGAGISWKVDAAWCDLARRRIARFADEGFALALWGMTDDSGDWNRRLLQDPARYMRDLAEAGMLDQSDMFILGLEMTEWGASITQLTAYRDAVRRVYSGAIGTHHNSGRMDYAGLGDVLMYQTGTGKSASQIRDITRDVLRRAGIPVWMFEMERQPARGLCEAALAEGAAGVANW